MPTNLVVKAASILIAAASVVSVAISTIQMVKTIYCAI
jgi:hypothetical protein